MNAPRVPGVAPGGERRDDDLRAELALRVELHRRRFLTVMAAGTGAAVLAACTSSGTSSGPEATPTTAGDAAPDPGPDTPVPDAPGITTDPFLLGVASGDPLPSSVILWTKLTTDLADPSGLGGIGDQDHLVRWEMATDDTFTDVVARGDEPALATFGHAVHVDADGLEPDTWYWYRFRIGDHISPAGRTRTTPAPEVMPDELRMVVASCQLRTAGHWTAYDHVVSDEPDVVVFVGDYIYEYPGGEGDLAVAIDGEPQTIADYRVLYAAYKRDPKIQAAHQVAPWVITWDDHEVENNYAAEVAEKPEDQAGFAERRRAGYQAFWEHLPVRIDPPADDGSLQVYRTLRYGALADLIVLDGRQHRTDQVCGDNIPTLASECPEISDEDNTMLGTEQEQWLADELAASQAVWTVLAQQTVMKALVLGDLVLNVDQWDGYPAARTRLFDAIGSSGTENVVVLTGDIHAGGAAELRSPDATITGELVAYELVTPGISSPGFGAIATGIDLSALGLAYANFEDNGYVRATITPERWTTEFVVVDTIATPTADASVAATVDIDAGRAGLVRRG